MFRQPKICSYLVFLSVFITPFQSHCLDAPQVTENEHVISKIAPPLYFKPYEMVVMSLEEWDNSSIDLPDVRCALEEYHATQPFEQSADEYLHHPNVYFELRLKALANLIDVIPVDNQTQTVSLLRNQAINKQLYILALPQINDPRCNKQILEQISLPSDPAIDYKNHGMQSSSLKSNDERVIISPTAPASHRLQNGFLSIRNSYWAEFLDPLHRAGPEMLLYKSLWQASSIPNYFIYLDTVENHALLGKYAPQRTQVKYCNSDQERAAHRISFKRGLAYRAGKLFDTSEFETNFSGRGFAIFVLGPDGELYTSNYIRHQLHHSSEFAGQDVLAAGEIMARRGRIIKITNKSGHYSPSIDNIVHVLAKIKRHTRSLKGMTVSIILAKGSKTIPIRATYDAVSLYQTRGNTLCTWAQFAWTPLHIAAWKDQFSLAEKAIKSSPIDAQTDTGLTALHLAVQNGSIPWIKLLLENKADNSLAALNGHTPLHLAAKKGDIEALQLLASASNLHKRGIKGETAAMLALQTDNMQGFLYLIEQGAKAKDVDRKGNGYLFYALSSPNDEIFKEMLKGSSEHELCLCNDDGETLLHIAAAYGNPKRLEVLTKLGLDPRACDSYGNTLLHSAVKNKNWANIEAILKSDLCNLLCVPNHDGATPFHLAASILPYEMLQGLLNYVDNLEVVDNALETPLFYAIRNNNVRNVFLLIEQGAKIGRSNIAGKAPIHIAAEIPQLPINTLLVLSDDLYLLDRDGNTPLLIALANQNISCAEYLIPYMSDEWLMHANSRGETAIQLAEKLSDARIYQMLMKRI